MPTTDTATLLESVGAPTDRAVAELDVRSAPPPAPLRRTLERLADLDDETVLLQRNDRAPQHLYPKLSDRGYAHGTVETDEGVVTAVWRE